MHCGSPWDGLHVAGCFAEDHPPLLLRTRGTIDPPYWGGHCGLVVGVFDCGSTDGLLESGPEHFDFPPMIQTIGRTSTLTPNFDCI